MSTQTAFLLRGGAVNKKVISRSVTNTNIGNIVNDDGRTAAFTIIQNVGQGYCFPAT